MSKILTTKTMSDIYFENKNPFAKNGQENRKKADLIYLFVKKII